MQWTKEKHAKYLFPLILIFGAIIYFALLEYLPNISEFGAALVKIGTGGLCFWLFDRFAMKDIETLEELKKGNVAYALFLLAYAIVIASAISL